MINAGRLREGLSIDPADASHLLRVASVSEGKLRAALEFSNSNEWKPDYAGYVDRGVIFGLTSNLNDYCRFQ